MRYLSQCWRLPLRSGEFSGPVLPGAYQAPASERNMTPPTTRPMLELPTPAGFALLSALAVLGTLLATAVASRSPKVA
jgi:hypothetical protein